MENQDKIVKLPFKESKLIPDKYLEISRESIEDIEYNEEKETFSYNPELPSNNFTIPFRNVDDIPKDLFNPLLTKKITLRMPLNEGNYVRETTHTYSIESLYRPYQMINIQDSLKYIDTLTRDVWDEFISKKQNYLYTIKDCNLFDELLRDFDVKKYTKGRKLPTTQITFHANYR
ncbi:uncharacterized protein CMU_035380 [Cryptosporidium muris RN66]|uniref:Uncharacterized protein n=1 Tax=Cryptosporidium muris (strain RN66) TaxID=441375 RepID=B6AGM5_CRYMR|nr:uncharacterized protein CMU_035380 [Cryptosporidium muris RN66]EEA07366.1 hypothetical protein CMU_035380 [Cryptosporidium muris RN66]|eukprot:XP_002141715.1 hypothetical protein [Cryptosporidium muris RN66]